MESEPDQIQLSYRPLRHADLPCRMFWLNDPETNKYLGTRVRNGTDLKFNEEWFDKYEKDSSREIFTVTHKGKPIGQVGLTSINPNDRNAELYVVIGEKEYRGRGLGKIMVGFILDYGFRVRGLHRIGLTVHVENVAAIRCYEGCGFSSEGILKESVFRNGRYEDEAIMGIINPDTEHISG